MPLSWWNSRSTQLKCIFVSLSIIGIFTVAYLSAKHYKSDEIVVTEKLQLKNFTNVNLTRSRRNSLRNGSDRSVISFEGRAKISGIVSNGSLFNGTIRLHNEASTNVSCILEDNPVLKISGAAKIDTPTANLSGNLEEESDANPFYNFEVIMDNKTNENQCDQKSSNGHNEEKGTTEMPNTVTFPTTTVKGINNQVNTTAEKMEGNTTSTSTKSTNTTGEKGAASSIKSEKKSEKYMQTEESNTTPDSTKQVPHATFESTDQKTQTEGKPNAESADLKSSWEKSKLDLGSDYAENTPSIPDPDSEPIPTNLTRYISKPNAISADMKSVSEKSEPALNTDYEKNTPYILDPDSETIHDNLKPQGLNTASVESKESPSPASSPLSDVVPQISAAGSNGKPMLELLSHVRESLQLLENIAFNYHNTDLPPLFKSRIVEGKTNRMNDQRISDFQKMMEDRDTISQESPSLMTAIKAAFSKLSSNTNASETMTEFAKKLNKHIQLPLITEEERDIGDRKCDKVPCNIVSNLLNSVPSFFEGAVSSSSTDRLTEFERGPINHAFVPRSGIAIPPETLESAWMNLPYQKSSNEFPLAPKVRNPIFNWFPAYGSMKGINSDDPMKRLTHENTTPELSVELPAILAALRMSDDDEEDFTNAQRIRRDSGSKVQPVENVKNVPCEVIGKSHFAAGEDSKSESSTLASGSQGTDLMTGTSSMTFADVHSTANQEVTISKDVVLPGTKETDTKASTVKPEELSVSMADDAAAGSASAGSSITGLSKTTEHDMSTDDPNTKTNEHGMMTTDHSMLTSEPTMITNDHSMMTSESNLMTNDHSTMTNESSLMTTVGIGRSSECENRTSVSKQGTPTESFMSKNTFNKSSCDDFNCDNKAGDSICDDVEMEDLNIDDDFCNLPSCNKRLFDHNVLKHVNQRKQRNVENKIISSLPSGVKLSPVNDIKNIWEFFTNRIKRSKVLNFDTHQFKPSPRRAFLQRDLFNDVLLDNIVGMKSSDHLFNGDGNGGVASNIPLETPALDGLLEKLAKMDDDSAAFEGICIGFGGKKGNCKIHRVPRKKVEGDEAAGGSESENEDLSSESSEETKSLKLSKMEDDPEKDSEPREDSEEPRDCIENDVSGEGKDNDCKNIPGRNRKRVEQNIRREFGRRKMLQSNLITDMNDHLMNNLIGLQSLINSFSAIDSGNIDPLSIDLPSLDDLFKEIMSRFNEDSSNNVLRSKDVRKGRQVNEKTKEICSELKKDGKLDPDCKEGESTSEKMTRDGAHWEVARDYKMPKLSSRIPSYHKDEPAPGMGNYGKTDQSCEDDDELTAVQSENDYTSLPDNSGRVSSENYGNTCRTESNQSTRMTPVMHSEEIKVNTSRPEKSNCGSAPPGALSDVTKSGTYPDDEVKTTEVNDLTPIKDEMQEMQMRTETTVEGSDVTTEESMPTKLRELFACKTTTNGSMQTKHKEESQYETTTDGSMQFKDEEGSSYETTTGGLTQTKYEGWSPCKTTISGSMQTKHKEESQYETTTDGSMQFKDKERSPYETTIGGSMQTKQEEGSPRETTTGGLTPTELKEGLSYETSTDGSLQTELNGGSTYETTTILDESQLIESEVQNVKDNVCLGTDCILEAADMFHIVNLKHNPCLDFFQFSCGKFIDDLDVPQYKVAVSQFNLLNDQQLDRVKKLLSSSRSHRELVPVQEAKKFYNACLSEDTLKNELRTLKKFITSKLGNWPVKNSRSDTFEMDQYVKSALQLGVNPNHFITFSVEPYDGEYLLHISSAKLSLPSSILVLGLKSSTVNAYLQFMKDVAKLLDVYEENEQEITNILRFEVQLAKIVMEVEEYERNRAHYTKMKLKDAHKKYSYISWSDIMRNISPNSRSVKQRDEIVFKYPKYVDELVELLEETSARVRINYAIWRVIAKVGLIVSPEINEKFRARFQGITNSFEKLDGIFDGTTLILEDRPRWMDCIDATKSAYSVAVSYMYAQKYFEPAAKSKAENIALAIRNKIKDLVSTSKLMDEKTRDDAVDKIEALEVCIGYDEEITNRRGLDNYYRDSPKDHMKFLYWYQEMNRFELNKQFSKLHSRSKRCDNLLALGDYARYRFENNDFVMAARFFQTPLFEVNRPYYLNFGAVGFVIAHFMLHSITFEGRFFDKSGVNVSYGWWGEGTVKNFLSVSQCLTEDYLRIKPATGIVNFKTLNEFVVDVGAIEVAYRAYKQFSEGETEPYKLPGLEWYTDDQLFWLSFGTTLCIKTRYNPSAETRMFLTVRNNKQFATDYDCETDTEMNPKIKCSLWI